jgi:CheY-like chemotaxis protein
VSDAFGRPVRVLFVEDAFDQALLVRTFLQPATSFEITHSQDGDQAAVLLREQTWDILITDLNLPGVDGFELCRIAKSVNPALPILAITGYTGPHFQEEAYRAGATDLQFKLGGGDVRTAVLAIGGLVGDVEMGCGGTLLKHASAEATVVVVPLCRDELDEAGVGLTAARAAAEVIGAKVIIDEEALDDTHRRINLMERIVKDLRPRFAYLPAMDDDHPARREAFRIAKATTATVPTLLGYQTATSGPDFKPTRFEDVGRQLAYKKEALTVYDDLGARRLDLSPRMAEAYARYWGRLERFGEVEPFEILRGT